MTLAELLAVLNDMPVNALDKQIYIVGGNEVYTSIAVGCITESCDETEVIAYVIYEDATPYPAGMKSVN